MMTDHGKEEGRSGSYLWRTIERPGQNGGPRCVSGPARSLVTGKETLID